MADKSLDLGQRKRKGFACKTYCVAGGARTGRAANSVHIGVRILREIIIDDVTDIWNVQPA